MTGGFAAAMFPVSSNRGSSCAENISFCKAFSHRTSFIFRAGQLLMLLLMHLLANKAIALQYVITGLVITLHLCFLSFAL